MKIKIAIIWANPYNKNMGVAALAYSALILVKEALAENGKDCEITFIGSSKSTKDSLLIDGDTLSFYNLEGLDYFSFKSFIKMIIQYGRFKLWRQLSFNYILDLGEGDSFSDIYGKARYKRILNSKIFFNLVGKKQLLLPQTIGPFKNKKYEKEAFDTLAQFKYIFGRDKSSFDYAKSFIDSSRIQESIDLAFYLPYKKCSFLKDKTHVGINISGLLWNGGYTRDDQFGLKTEYKSLIHRVIDHFKRDNQIEIHLVPHVVPLDTPIEDDYSVCLELKTKYPFVTVAQRFQSPIEAKSYIAGLDFFTGARMHATIAAFSSNVPVFPMAYSRKFNGLYKETLKYSWMGDCVNEDNDQVFNGLIKSFSAREEIKEKLIELNRNIVKPRISDLKTQLSRLLVSD